MTSNNSHAQTEIAFDRIFHPTDFSEASDLAFAHALKLATHRNGRLTMLHTEEKKQRPDWTEFPRVRQTLERWGFLAPGSTREDVAALGLNVAKIAAWEDDPVNSTLEYLGKHPHDLIVLATHQYDGLERWLHRTVAEPIARRAGEMALFVPQGVDGFIAIENGAATLRNILIPVDRTPPSQAALEAASALAASLQCTGVVFTLLYVGAAAEAPQVRRSVRAGQEWHLVVKEGAIEQAILQTAHETRADLIVMATAGRHGFLDALRGSTTERIVRTAEVPVLAVPALVKESEQVAEAFVWQPTF
ncbi:MAG: universal stress protein [Acidobacteria bacterium]|nr:universal stress protein [Acidobacteriota bacterium]MBI3426792.1 universal stress protein [Acidobacteriota bacterium]